MFFNICHIFLALSPRALWTRSVLGSPAFWKLHPLALPNRTLQSVLTPQPFFGLFPGSPSERWFVRQFPKEKQNRRKKPLGSTKTKWFVYFPPLPLSSQSGLYHQYGTDFTTIFVRRELNLRCDEEIFFGN